MRKSVAESAGKPALELIEEATQLLRNAPAGVLLGYYVGSVPAMIGLLYFFSDMSRGAFAPARLIEEALAAAGLYIWMKCWHAVFARGLRAFLAAEAPPHWTFARVARLVLVQTAIQPTGLFARIIAAQIVVPYVWVYGFYQNVCVLGDGETSQVRDVLRRSAAQTGLWPRQAHYALLLLFAFAFFIALNVSVATLLAPRLLKMFFDIETVFSRSPMSLLNSTVLATVAALTYLCFDPIRKAIYVLRCFYGTALQSGADLRAELRSTKIAARRMATIAASVALVLSASVPIRAAGEEAVEMDAAHLDNAIERVLQRREYAWRLPREKAPASERGWLATMVNDFSKAAGHWMKKGFDLVDRFFDLMRKWFGGDSSDKGLPHSGWSVADAARPLLYGTIALILVLLAVLLWRMRKQTRDVVAAAPVVAPVPDLQSESVTADQLPEEGWLQLARQLIESGELRLALRASYLAALAHLGERQLITVARHKSNRDYDCELRRRVRSRDDLIAAFDKNVQVFEGAWYGEHGVTIETLGTFNENLETIRAC